MHLYERPDHDFLWDGRLWQKRPIQADHTCARALAVSTEHQIMRMQHAYRVDECLLVCGQPSATWAELGSPRDKTIAMSTARKLLWLRHASADQARQLQAAVPSMDLEKASKSWLPRPSPGRTAASWISFDGFSRRNGIAQFADSQVSMAVWTA